MSEFLYTTQCQNYYVAHNVRITMYHTMSEYYVTDSDVTMSELLCSTQWWMSELLWVTHNDVTMSELLCNTQWCHNVRITVCNT